MAGGNLMRDAMVETLRDIKAAGYATAIITNNVREVRDGWRSLIPVDELIDHVFDSSELGMRKPDQAIYRYALEQMGNVPAGRAVFLDDVEQNVQSARDVGLHGIHVSDDPTDAIQQLRTLLGM
jgi:putative hydrolase of the HAD superfamily